MLIPLVRFNFNTFLGKYLCFYVITRQIKIHNRERDVQFCSFSNYIAMVTPMPLYSWNYPHVVKSGSYCMICLLVMNYPFVLVMMVIKMRTYFTYCRKQPDKSVYSHKIISKDDSVPHVWDVINPHLFDILVILAPDKSRYNLLDLKTSIWDTEWDFRVGLQCMVIVTF